jgi:hypothetical protein
MNRKNVFKAFGIIVLVMIIGLSFAACDTGGGGGGGGGNPTPSTVTYTSKDNYGNTYVLKFTENTAKAAYSSPSPNDTYELTINPGSKKSKGTVSGVSGELTLKPEGSNTTFKVTRTGGEMTASTGTITLEGGDTVDGPGPVTKGGGEHGFPGIDIDITFTGVESAEDISFTDVITFGGEIKSFDDIFTAPSGAKVEVKKDGTLTLKLGEVKDTATQSLDPASLKYFCGSTFADAILCYANKDGTISGTFKTPDFISSYKLDLILKQGWNWLLEGYIDLDTETGVIVSGQPDSSFKWRVNKR